MTQIDLFGAVITTAPVKKKKEVLEQPKQNKAQAAIDFDAPKASDKIELSPFVPPKSKEEIKEAKKEEKAAKRENRVSGDSIRPLTDEERAVMFPNGPQDFKQVLESGRIRLSKQAGGANFPMQRISPPFTIEDFNHPKKKEPIKEIKPLPPKKPLYTEFLEMFIYNALNDEEQMLVWQKFSKRGLSPRQAKLAIEELIEKHNYVL